MIFMVSVFNLVDGAGSKKRVPPCRYLCLPDNLPFFDVRNSLVLLLVLNSQARGVGTRSRTLCTGTRFVPV